jgi:hypothetical protein
MAEGFKVTVEDLKNGEKQAMVVAEGDYMLIPFAPCYLHNTDWSANGTIVVTLKGHRPAHPAQVVSTDG